jgi:threonyl-tRNA synthetase
VGRVCVNHLPSALRVFVGRRGAGLRVELDDRSEKLGYKIREAQVQKVPYMLVVGEREAQQGAVSVRKRSGEDLGALPVERFLAEVTVEVDPGRDVTGRVDGG